MPTANQLVRKGRATPKVKTKTPHCGSAASAASARVYDDSKKPNSALRKVARVRLRTASRSVRTSPARATTFGAAQGRARPAHERHGGRRLHPRRGPQPPGALGRARPRRSRQDLPGFRYKVIRGGLDSAGVTERRQAPLEVRREEGVGDAPPRRDPAAHDRGRRRPRLGARRAGRQPAHAERQEVRRRAHRSTTRSRSRPRRPASRSSRCSSRP
mgnify:CR=1 FL=1